MKKFDEATQYNFRSLLAEVGGFDGSLFMKRDGYSFIKVPGSVWPNLIFDVDAGAVNGAMTDSVIADIREYDIQPLAICEDNAGLNTVFKEKGFMPIDRWLNMHMTIDFTPDIWDNGIAVSLVEQTDIAAWTKIVSKILFNSKPLDEAIFSRLNESNADIVVAKIDNEIVGTTLIYYDDTGTAGLYMVGVVEEHRGKRIGRMLLDATVDLQLSRGNDLCILQSTKKGLPLYTRYGFESDSYYNLLYKVK